VYHAAWELGLDVPSKLSLVGYDDMPLAEYLRPPLTTVRTPLAELGAAAVDALVDQLLGEEPRDVVVGAEPEVVVRSSTTELE
jgi:DNA-binding LacI/PurR family transcriptional regulator